VMRKALTGAYAAAEAMRQINPDVVAAYPITPQTPIMERFAYFVNNGLSDTELIRVESEHSAMSAVVGASAAGVRAMTATSSVGLALMFEVVNAASGLRLPIVMNVVNRALSAPINIHGDHSDSMACRDAGWIQIYSENPQEVYEHTLLATKLSEDHDVLIPSMIMQDGFITSHSVEPVDVLNDEVVKQFVGEFRPKHSLLLDEKPLTIGALELYDYFFETKRQQEEAMNVAKQKYYHYADELSKLTGNKYPMAEKYLLDDAEIAIVALNSAASTTRVVVDRLRAEGKKVGLLKIRLFRPFPYEEVQDALKNVNFVGVLDRSFSFGADAPIFGEIKNALYDLDKKPKLQSYIFGLGGRELYEKDIELAFNQLLLGNVSKEKRYLNLRE